MPASTLTPWFLIGFLVVACGSESNEIDTKEADSSSVAHGGSGFVIASSDTTAVVGSTTSKDSGTGCCTTTASAGAGSGGAVPTSTACSTTGSSATNSAVDGAVDGAAGDPSSSDGGASGGAGQNGETSGGGAGHDPGDAATGGELVPPIPLGALMISEYVEGSSGSDKAIELSNLGSEPLALEACRLVIYFNGKSTPGTKIVLSGALPPGSSHVLCHSSSSPELMSHCDQTSGSASFNGDDALVLECDAVAHDAIGQIGVLPPNGQWGNVDLSTKDQSLRRRCGATPRSDPSSAFDIALDWVNVSIEAFTGLGDPACIELTEPAGP